MDVGTWEMVQALESCFSKTFLVRILEAAECGDLSPRAWNFWCLRLDVDLPYPSRLPWLSECFEATLQAEPNAFVFTARAPGKEAGNPVKLSFFGGLDLPFVKQPDRAANGVLVSGRGLGSIERRHEIVFGKNG